MSSNFIIETNNLCKSFGNKQILRNVSLHIPKGSIYALLGPNGAGKTTTIRILTGIMKPTSGDAIVQGIDVVRNPELIRSEIGILSQLSAGYKDFKTRDNILLFTSIVGVDKMEATIKMEELLRLLEMEDKLDLNFGKLSGGEKRVISLVRTIISSGDLIILDEPTTGLDIARAKLVRDIIHDLVKREGRTVVMSSHITSDLEDLATHTGILKDGELVFEGTKEEVIQAYAPDSNFEDAIITSFKIGNNQTKTKAPEELPMEEGK
ncbi:MAG: ABC transporter ATP-binding protein [Candidatus Heimdallarchaeota archaeon]|nr:ABC transporter ATP-binding protein [Candidatus Heimdallarchaeota archaeon]MBY8993681.1 ABC transporter ATP-binding protein [Candidatus Heimdallarchaeota archaeon]